MTKKEIMKEIMEPDAPVIFHIDVNSAFLSWSAIRLLKEGSDVDLREIPAIIGGDESTRHGIVVAKSLKAKAYGIRTADTVASARSKCPDLVIQPPDHAYYREQSRQLMEHLYEICPVIQQVSVDECYMSFEPVRDRFSSPEEAARYIKDSVRESFGYTVNIGISDRKVLAKMASDFQKPDKVHTLYHYEIRKKLWPLPVEELYMCGRSSAAFLKKMGVKTIGDLAVLDRQMVQTWLKSQGNLLWNYANGIDDSAVEPEPSKAKGIGNSTTLSNDAQTREECRKVLRMLTEKVAGRMKKEGVRASQISVEIKYATFVSVSHQMGIQPAAAAPEILFAKVGMLFDELWSGEPVRLLGVRVSKLEEENAEVQMNLFDYQKESARSRKQKDLEEAMEKIRRRYGAHAVYRGTEEWQKR